MMSLDMAEAVVFGGRNRTAGLTVLYDRRCPLCRRLKTWLAHHPTTVAIEFLAAGSPEALRRFPALDHHRTQRVLTVVTDRGAVYEAERAWLVCAWALPEWQPLAERFGTPLRLRLVRVVARTIDGYRHRRIVDADGVPCDSCRVAAEAQVAPSAR